VSTLADEIAEAALEDQEHLAYLLLKDYCLLVHESGKIIVCSGHEHAQRHPNFGAPGWTLEDGVYLVGTRCNKGYALTEKMLRAEYWGS